MKKTIGISKGALLNQAVEVVEKVGNLISGCIHPCIRPVSLEFDIFKESFEEVVKEHTNLIPGVKGPKVSKTRDKMEGNLLNLQIIAQEYLEDAADENAEQARESIVNLWDNLQRFLG